jgi:hypothetical protein
LTLSFHISINCLSISFSNSDNKKGFLIKPSIFMKEGKM